MVTDTGAHRLSGVVMCHPSRLSHATRVADAVGRDLVDVVMDPEPDGPPTALRTTIRAWESAAAGATHHLVLHDDMVPTARLWPQALAAINALPDAALALCAFWSSRNGAAARLGVLGGHSWVTAVNEYTPCIALILPADVAAGFGAFARAAGDAWPEDVLMYRYLKAHGVPTYVAAPSLAEHQDLRSLSGNDFHGVRRAACLLTDDIATPAVSVGRPEAVPFFKHGLAQCAVRSAAPGIRRWENISTARYLSRIGHDVEEAHASLASYRGGGWAPQRHDVDVEATIVGTWLTAYAMGVVSSRPPQAPLPPLTRRALGTVAPGGVCERIPPRDIDGLQDDFAPLAVAGYEAGLRSRAVRKPNRSRPGRGGDGAVVVVSGARFPAERIADGLADVGHRVTVEPTAPGGALAVVGCRPLPLSPPPGGGSFPTSAVASASIKRRITVVTETYGVVGQDRTVLAGDLYGPGMPLDGVLAGFITRALMRQPIVLRGDPDRVVRPLHLDDLISVVDAMLSDDADDGCVRVAAAPITVRDLATLVTQVVRPVSVLQEAAPPSSDPADAQRCTAQDCHQVEPMVPLADGIRGLAQWIAYEADAPLQARSAPDPGQR